MRKALDGSSYSGIFWTNADIDKDGSIAGFELDREYLRTASVADPELPNVLINALYMIRFKAIGNAQRIRVLLPVGMDDFTAETVKQRGIELRKEKGIE
jgi:hypothetical protein